MPDTPVLVPGNDPAGSKPARRRAAYFSLPIPLANRNLPFWRGFFAGALFMLPAIAVALRSACQVLAFDPSVPEGAAAVAELGLLLHLRNVVLFGGLVGAISCGGVGRAVWHGSMRRSGAVVAIMAAVSGALVGMGLAIIGFAALGLPLDAETAHDMANQSGPLLWRAALAGTLPGLIIGWWCRIPRSSQAGSTSSPATAVLRREASVPSLISKRSLGTPPKRRKKPAGKRPRK